MMTPTQSPLTLAMHRLALCLCAAFVAAILALPPSPAHAQRDMRKLERALTNAQRAYDLLELDRAERELTQAIDLAERQGLGNESITASLYIFLGVIRHPTGGDAAARDAFTTAMLIDPNVEIPPDYQTPTLVRILDEVRASSGGGGTGFGDNGGGGFNPPPDDFIPDGATQIVHTPVETANAGDALYFEAAVPSSVPLYRVLLHHRRYGEAGYATREMTPRGRTSFETTLPGAQVCSSQIDYYIEVLDRADVVLIATGGPNSPLNIFVFGASQCGELNLGSTTRPTDDGGGDDDDGDGQVVYFQLTGGTGFGLATAKPIANPDVVLNPGIAAAPVHVGAELGFYLSPTLQLGAFYRNQFVLLTGGTEIEPMFGLKMRWWFANEGTFRLFTGLGAGYGFVRHTVDLRPALEFIDTAQHGPLHVGLPLGLGIFLNDHVALVADLYIPILFPNVSVHIDAAAGLRFSF